MRRLPSHDLLGAGPAISCTCGSSPHATIAGGVSSPELIGGHESECHLQSRYGPRQRRLGIGLDVGRRLKPAGSRPDDLPTSPAAVGVGDMHRDLEVFGKTRMGDQADKVAIASAPGLSPTRRCGRQEDKRRDKSRRAGHGVSITSGRTVCRMAPATVGARLQSAATGLDPRDASPMSAEWQRDRVSVPP